MLLSNCAMLTILTPETIMSVICLTYLSNAFLCLLTERSVSLKSYRRLNTAGELPLKEKIGFHVHAERAI